MLDQETKRRINSARDILVGKVPDPKSQIEQITNALIYKFMDDMDRESEELGGNPSFLIGGLAEFAWGKLMDTRLSGDERWNRYSRALESFAKSTQIPELFRTIFKSAYLPFRDSQTLNLFLKEISNFQYDHSEKLGDAFEYLLSILGSQGDAGQFRTPRHIIDFIVEVVAPQKNETILDPACGTAGFLISAYKYIKKYNSDDFDEKKAYLPFVHTTSDDVNSLSIQSNGKYKGDKLTPEDNKKLAKNITGYDIAPEMSRLSLVNLYLHGFAEPKITEYDTLTSDDQWDENFDVILANPPFMTPKGGIRPHNKFAVSANRAEVLFVDYIAEHLNPKGRAGIIVPEGIIFQSANSYKLLRKNLIENWGLYAVLSLPNGVFNPYSGVKTSILFIDKQLAKKTKDFLFIKVANDGFDLGAQRRKIDKNDLGEAFKLLKEWQATQTITESNIAHNVSKEKIAENGEYNLTGDRYRETVDYSNAKWEMVELGEVCEIYNGATPKRTEHKYWNNGVIPWFTVDDIREQGRKITTTKQKITPQGLKNSSLKLLPKKTVLLCCTASVGEYAIAEIELTSNQQFNGLVVKSKYEKLLLPEFLFWLVSSLKLELERLSGKTSFNFVPVKTVKKIKIPLPPLEFQKQIVTEIEQCQKVIDGAKQVVQNYKPSFRIDPDWQIVELGEICETTSGGTPLKSKDEYYENGTIPWLRSGEVSQGKVYKSELFITEQGLKNSSAKLFPKNTALVAMYGATAGQVGLLKFESTTNQAICGILPNDKFMPEFLYQILKSQKDIMIRLAGGGAQPNISQTIIKKLKIPLPPLEVQKQIVAEIDSEQKAVDECKNLIAKMETKIKTKISELWQNKPN